MKDINNRLNQSERKSALDRLNWSGDFRFMGYSYTANIPSHFDGMQLQNLHRENHVLHADQSGADADQC